LQIPGANSGAFSRAPISLVPETAWGYGLTHQPKAPALIGCVASVPYLAVRRNYTISLQVGAISNRKACFAQQYNAIGNRAYYQVIPIIQAKK